MRGSLGNSVNPAGKEKRPLYCVPGAVRALSYTWSEIFTIASKGIIGPIL